MNENCIKWTMPKKDQEKLAEVIRARLSAVPRKLVTREELAKEFPDPSAVS